VCACVRVCVGGGSEGDPVTAPELSNEKNDQHSKYL
jgi:hypothetical protein